MTRTIIRSRAIAPASTLAREEIAAGVYACGLDGRGAWVRTGVGSAPERGGREEVYASIWAWLLPSQPFVAWRGYTDVRFTGLAPLAWSTCGYAQCLFEATDHGDIGEWTCRGRTRVEWRGIDGWRAEGRTSARFGGWSDGDWVSRGATDARWSAASTMGAAWKVEGRACVRFFGPAGTPLACLTGDGEMGGEEIKNFVF
jgi:hypothetical protein